MAEEQKVNGEQQQQPPPPRQEAVIPLSTYKRDLRKSEDRGSRRAQAELLGSLGFPSIEDLNKSLGGRKLADILKAQADKVEGTRAGDQQARPQTEAQRQAAQAVPPKQGESQEDWLERASKALDEKLEAKLKEKLSPYDERIEKLAKENEALRAEREEAELARTAEAAWKEFRVDAQSKHGVRGGKALKLVEREAQAFVDELDEDELDALDDMTDVERDAFWDERFWKPLREDEATRALFKSDKEAAPVPSAAGRTPATTGTRAGDRKPPDSAEAQRQEAQRGAEKNKYLKGRTADVDAAFERIRRGETL